MPQEASCLSLHASCVAFEGRGILIRGASGSGKSALALQLMAFGAELVSDDQVQIRQEGLVLQARAPAPLLGQIEARYLGILTAKPVISTEICAMVDLDQVESERLPPRHYERILGVDIQIFLRVDGVYFAAALMQFLKSGALDPDEYP